MDIAELEIDREDIHNSLVAEGCRCVLAYIQCFIGDSGKTNHTEPKSA